MKKITVKELADDMAVKAVILCNRGRDMLFEKDAGIDGILVTVGLCIIALLLCVVMKDSLSGFIRTIVDAMTTKANTILNGTAAAGGV